MLVNAMGLPSDTHIEHIEYVWNGSARVLRFYVSHPDLPVVEEGARERPCSPSFISVEAQRPRFYDWGLEDA